MRKHKHRLEIKADLVERSFFQWTLIRALAFGERDWIVLCSLMFLGSKTRDFLTVPGVTGMALGIMFLGPVFGILIFYASKFIFYRLKNRGRLPQTRRGMNMIAWAANALCFPVILGISWESFNLFYESYDSVLKSVLDSVHF